MSQEAPYTRSRVVGLGLTSNATISCELLADTVTEAVAVPEELRAKVGEDYGRSKGIAWYALCAFGITHADNTSAETKSQARIIKWSSAA